MRFLVAVALLVLAVAEAHHTPEHKLSGPRFSIGKLHVYDVEWNVTAGIRGLSSQASKSAFRAKLHIYPKSEKEHFLKFTNVHTSDSVRAVSELNGDVPMQKNSALEDKLSRPIKFILENGKVSRYSLSPEESPESRKIKKAFLRSLEMYVPEHVTQQLESNSKQRKIPITYNVTKPTVFGEHTTYYMITVSPNVEFPYSDVVYNITRSEDFENERYPSYNFHHNLDSQGCPEVCRWDWASNKYGVRCPAGYEPHKSPMQTYLNHKHHMALENGVMTPEFIESTEVHNAKMYDQDMSILIRINLKKVGYRKATIEEPTGETYTNLSEQEPEINTLEINEKCGYKSARDAAETAKTLLREIAEIIVKGDLEDARSTMIGERIILLQSALSKLEVPHLENVAANITRLGALRSASEMEKIKRQIWMDILPVIGTQSSVSFIIKYIKTSLETKKEMMVWEAKEILEALPQNIHYPTRKNIEDLQSLLELKQVKEVHLLHSAVYTCLGRVVGSMCNETVSESGSWPVRQSPEKILRQSRGSNIHFPDECPRKQVENLVKLIDRKLRSSDKKEAIITYLQTLAYMGVPEVLPIISEYAYGTAESIQKFKPSAVEFIRSSAVFFLHSLAKKQPGRILEIVAPLYFNETEAPQLRTAAFGVLIRCQPPMELLQHVAILSWREKSKEVGSYVTSTLDTFGNSSIPCMEVTSHRIKQVMPMLRRFDIGVQHAKNLMWTYYDDVRDFGLKGHSVYTPSNESIVPRAMYHGLSYSQGSLTDTIMQGALHIQGLTQRHIVEYIDRSILGINPPESLSPEQEHNIFEEAHIAERVPDELRFTIHRRMFYSSSFYYLDQQNMKTQLDTFREYFRNYVSQTSYDYSGHLVKVYLPSTFHTETVAYSLPYPVEFKMMQPVVMALKIKTLERSPAFNKFHIAVRPSVYLSKLYTNQIKNIGDCKEVGVYHEHKIAMSLPFEIRFKVEGLKKLAVSFKMPELPKKVLYYYTEAGTFAGKKSFHELPSSEYREPIRTLPSPFQYSPEVNIVGLPPFKIDLQLEDTELISEMTPRNPMEALHIIVKRVLNAGWRYKTANITLKDDSTLWPRDTEVTFNIDYDRTHVTKEKLRMNPSQPWSRKESPSAHQDSQWGDRQDSLWSSQDPTWPEDQTEDYSRGSEWVTEPDDEQLNTESSQSAWPWPWKSDDNSDNTNDDWSQDMRRTDPKKDSSFYVRIAKRYFALISQQSHISHKLNVQIKTKPETSRAYIRFHYNHTHSKSDHAIEVEAAIRKQRESTERKISLAHYMSFRGKPDEFRYDTHMGKHEAHFITAFRSHKCECSPWDELDVLLTGVFYYEPLDSILNKELQSKIDSKFFLPEKHQQCMKDVQDGQPLSENCVKASNERDIYNKLRLLVLWNKDLPQSVRTAGLKFDSFFKYLYYNHMTVKYAEHVQNRLWISVDHIDKLTDEPVYDVVVKKPKETIYLRRVKSLPFGLSNPLSSIHDVLGVNWMEFTNNTYPPTCVMMKNYVRTYDLKSYPLNRLDRCRYVLSAHCANYKNFAIIAKILSPQGEKEIHMHIGPHTIVLTPMKGNDYKIKFDDHQYTISDARVFSEDSAEIYVYPEEYSAHHKHLTVVARKAGVRVTYDGENVKVQIDARYKGETCGLCSEFDGETLREYRGIDRCLYSHPDDFVNSAITNRDECKREPLYPYHCDSEENSRSMFWRRGESKGDEYEPTLKRNMIVYKGNEVCFSVRAVSVCEENAHPTDTESKSLGFHCLPKQDITARRLVLEAKRRTLGELENKSVDYEDDVECPKMCSE